MIDKTEMIISNFKETISENVIMTVLKTQQLVKEMHEDGSSS